MRSKKASEGLVSTKLITIILICLVIVAVLIGIYKGDLINFANKIPGYSYAPDREISWVDLPPQEQVQFEAFKVGEIVYDERFSYKKSYLNIQDLKTGNYIKTGIYLESNMIKTLDTNYPMGEQKNNLFYFNFGSKDNYHLNYNFKLEFLFNYNQFYEDI